MLRAELRTPLGALALDVALAVEPGRCLALAGPSGAGKTSILRVIAGLLRPARGIVECAGERWLDTGAGIDRPPERREVGFVFQDYALFPHLRAWENVAYPLRALPRRERAARARELLERLGAGDRADARPRELSGGERQRVALARALARKPRVLLLDEPLAALDSHTHARAAREVSEAIRLSGAAALLVTHRFAEAAHVGDRIAIVDRGRLVQEGDAAGLAARPASAFVADFTGAIVLSGTAGPGPGGLTEVALDGGGRLFSTDLAAGRVAASVLPWEISVDRAPEPHEASARNALDVEIVSLTRLGNRVRLGLAGPQPLAAEVSAESASGLGLRPGDRVTARWKAVETRLVPL